MRKNRKIKILSAAIAVWLFVAPIFAQASVVAPQPFLVTSDGYPAAGHVSGQNEFVSAASADLPSQWDSRTLGCVTSVKDQGRANCCWAFASVGAMETSFILQGYGTAASTDFSEAHLAWFGLRQRVTDPSDPTCGDGIMYSNPYIQGGEWRYMASALMRGSGMQLEQNAPWYLLKDQHVSDYGDTLMRNMAQQESTRYTSYARLWSAEEIMDLSKEKAKQKIMENGAVIMSYNHDYGTSDVYFNRNNACYYKGQYVERTNHSVVVVGWDDSFSRLNFNSGARPRTDGAWLVKGSWGEVYGNNGYYWLSYAEPSIMKIATVKAAPTNIYDRIYQYDGSFPIGYFPDDSGSGMGNVFTAGQDELLTHVAFFNMNESPTQVTIDVYLSGGETSYTERHDPTNGMRRIETARTTMQDVGYGYFTTELTEPVPIHAGEQFFVYVSFRSYTGAEVIVPIEGPTIQNPPEGQVTYGGNPGESYVNLGGYWYDIGDMTADHIDYNNVPVKAMTRDPDSNEQALYVQNPPDKTQYRIGETVDLTGLSLLYVNVFGEQIPVKEGFTCSAEPFAATGTQSVEVMYGDLSCTVEVFVSRTAGDADGDGAITTRDVALMRRVLAGWKDVSAYAANFDVNGDGVLTLVDVALVTRYLAGGYNVVLV